MVPSSTPNPPAGHRHRKPRWLKEIALIAAFYAVYSLARNLSGSAQIARGETPQRAFDNAILVMRLERLLGLVSEQRVQARFLAYDWFIRVWNVFYGTLHFVAPAATLVVLAVFAPAQFARWRNVLGFTTALAIIGFWLFPLMPPRLLDYGGPYGGARLAESGGYGQFGFTDTLATVGGLWSFETEAVVELSNQYAAMPSLHVAWATWCTLALGALTRRRWLRALLVLYPLATLFGIVVTANHFWVDGVAALLTLGFGYAAASALDHRASAFRPPRT